MALQRNTVILVAAAIALGGVVLVTETLRSSNGGGVAQKSGDRLFTFEEAQIKTLTIERQEETLKFERDQEDVWQMTEPESAIAEQASIAFLLSLLTTEPSTRTLTITPDQKADFGFTSPIGAIQITLDNDETHTLVLGGKDFSGGALYVQVDPASEPADSEEAEIEIHVAAIDLINGVERPLEEWKAVVVDTPEDTADSTPDPAAVPTTTSDAASEAPAPSEEPQAQPSEAPPENSANPTPETNPQDTTTDKPDTNPAE